MRTSVTLAEQTTTKRDGKRGGRPRSCVTARLGQQVEQTLGRRLDLVIKGLDMVCAGWPGVAPGLLTEDEAIAYLRLDTINIADPRATLRRYRENGQLRGTQVSKRVFYLREELDAFLKRVTHDTPR